MTATIQESAAPSRASQPPQTVPVTGIIDHAMSAIAERTLVQFCDQHANLGAAGIQYR